MQFTPAQDESALVRAARTDTEVFALLYDRYVQQLYHYCYHRTNNITDAEDLTSQTFLAALEAFPHYRRDGHFAAWLFTIARNKVVDYYRRTPNVPLEESMVPPFHSDLAGEMENSQQKGILLDAIRALTEDEQELIRLRYVAELPFGEIAKALRKSESATKKMLYRLLARLKRQMEAEHE
jgi:RNA polymerase sigma-70 factor (ECF subfamily)